MQISDHLENEEQVTENKTYVLHLLKFMIQDWKIVTCSTKYSNNGS